MTTTDELVARAETMHPGKPQQWDPQGCIAWMESAERVCRKARVVGLLCARHDKAAIKRLAAQTAKAAADLEKALAKRAQQLPGWRAELAKINEKIERLDPAPPTNDVAAFLGQGSRMATRYRTRYSDTRIHELAVLHERASRLRSMIGVSK